MDSPTELVCSTRLAIIYDGAEATKASKKASGAYCLFVFHTRLQSTAVCRRHTVLHHTTLYTVLH